MERKLYQKAQRLPKIQYIEFQEAMKIEKLQKQFLEKSWKEVKEIINLRIEVRKTSISEDLEDGGLNTNEFTETQKSMEDLEIEDNFRKYGIGDLKTIDFGNGTVKPNLWGYQAPKSKKKRK